MRGYTAVEAERLRQSDNAIHDIYKLSSGISLSDVGRSLLVITTITCEVTVMEYFPWTNDMATASISMLHSVMCKHYS